MSTLNVSNITDGTDTVETGYVLNGSAKSWATFDGTGTVGFVNSNSFNASSATDNGTGDYTYSFTSNMARAQYPNAGNLNTGSNYANIIVQKDEAALVGSITFFTGYVGTTTFTKSDYDEVPMTVHGDLA